jgi:alcohol dehydrogenase
MEKMECRAAIFTEVKSIECGVIPFPQIETTTDAILKVRVSGICGSDLHPYHGREPCAFGTAFGHECVGEIVSLGVDVTNFSIGDLVSVPFSIACGKCFYCQQYLSARCQESQLLGHLTSHSPRLISRRVERRSWERYSRGSGWLLR